MGKIRDITFDIAKGIGIVLVVIGHYIPDNAPSWYIGFVSFVYHFHMPLFFMIAGFFYERSIKKVGYWRFVRSKFERLMFPYFILSWAIIGIKILVDGFMPGFDKRFISSVLFAGSRVFFMVRLCFVFNILYRPGFQGRESLGTIVSSFVGARFLGYGSRIFLY